MAFPTVEDVKRTAAAYFGDTAQDVFDDDVLQPAFATAWRELYAAMHLYELGQIRIITTYTLPSGTTSLTPATAGITNFAGLRQLRERPSGQSVDYAEVVQVDDLAQRDAGANLIEYVLRDGAFKFVGATQNTQLEIDYWASGVAPTTGEIAIDGVENFLWARTVALAGPGKGYTAEAREADVLARGPRLNREGYLGDFVSARVREMQSVQVQPRPFSMGSGGRMNRRYPFIQV